MVEALIKTIADEIVDFVERAGEPVTPAQIEREVPGFKADDNAASSWEFVTRADQEDENLIWDEMSKEGFAALQQVLQERRVAMQPATFWDGRRPVHANWVPISLVPARMANVDTGRVLISGSQQVVDLAMAHAKNEGVVGFRVLHPATCH